MRAVCSEGGFAKVQATVKAARDYRDHLAKWVQWQNDDPSAEAEMYDGQIDYTTAAPMARLSTTEKSYAHPFSTTTAKPDYTADRYMALEAINDAGEEAYNEFCAQANMYVAKAMAPKLASVWFNDFTHMDDVAPRSPFLDFWNVMNENGVDRNLNSHLQTILINANFEMTHAFEGACNHRHADWNHMDVWNTEWEAHVADMEYLESVGFPHPSLKMIMEDELEVMTLTGLHAINADQQAAVCALGNSDYAPSNPIDQVAGEEFWLHARAIPNMDPLHYIARIARLQELPLNRIMALDEAPHSILKAFATHPDTSKEQCDATLTDISEVLVSGVWDDDLMSAVKASGKRISYLMRQCHDVAEHHDENDDERNLFLQCDDPSTWVAEHTVGPDGDITLKDFQRNLISCYDAVAGRLGQFFNKAKEEANQNGDNYCSSNVYMKWVEGEAVPLGALAWWEYGTTDPWFHCLEDILENAHEDYTDPALRACSILSGVEPSVFDGLAEALEGVQEQNMVDLRNHIHGVYSRKLVQSNTGWVTVTRDGDQYSSMYVPSVEVVVEADSSDKTEEQFAKDLQNSFNIGLATEVMRDGNTFTARYDQPLDEVQPRVEWLVNIMQNGLEGYAVQSIAFPPHFPTLHEEFQSRAGKAADKIEYNCALNPHAESENAMFIPVHEAEPAESSVDVDAASSVDTTEAAAEPAPANPADPAPADPAPATPAPASPASEDTSSASKVGLAVASAVAFAALY